jgi:hypothetical protein
MVSIARAIASGAAAVSRGAAFETVFAIALMLAECDP